MSISDLFFDMDALFSFNKIPVDPCTAFTFETYVKTAIIKFDTIRFCLVSI